MTDISTDKTEKIDLTLQQNENFLRNAYTRAVLPCMLSILCGNITILADGILVAQRIGTNALAAVNLCVPVSLVLCVVGSFLVSGSAIQASRCIGQGNEEQGQAFYSTAIVSCVVASLLMTLLGLALLMPLVNFLGADDTLRYMVRDYTAITIIGALPKILLYVPFWFLRLDGRNRIVTAMMVVMGVGNVILDLLFLYVFNWGVAGAAWASVISTAAACVLGFACLWDKYSGFRFKLRCLRDKESWKNIAIAGSPSALNNLSQTFRVLVVNTLLMAAGGRSLVAMFSAVNCIAAFSQCVTDGVPQAASAMLGVYSGERDNGSTRLLFGLELRRGLLYSLVFSAIIIAGADIIGALYDLSDPLRLPLVCLSVSMFPGLLCSILSGFYNVSGRALFANLIIICRVFIFSCLGLFLLVKAEWDPWLFLIIGEVGTLIVWYIAARIISRRQPQCSPYLLLDESIDSEGRILNFSVEGNEENICYASERVSEFCEEVGMNPKQLMRISLAIEEIMTLLLNVNGGAGVVFDVRVFSLQGVTGIRIRYDGKEFNPFNDIPEEEEDMYMGIRMMQNLVNMYNYQRTFGMNMVQLLL